MFNNQIFDSWLNHKADEILSKVNRETISTEEMIVLILKAQTNHFYHMDQETKEDMTGLRSEMKEFKAEIRQDMADFKTEMKEEFKKIDTKFMWSTGVTVTMFLGLYLKLFLG